MGNSPHEPERCAPNRCTVKQLYHHKGSKEGGNEQKGESSEAVEN